MPAAPQPTVTWGIANLEREVDSGYVHTAHWTASLTIDDYSASAYGSVGLARPEDDLIPFPELTKEQVIGWVKDKLGAEQVETIETGLASQITEQQLPKKLSGTPWS